MLKRNQTFMWVVMQVDGGSGITRDKRPRVKVGPVELEIARHRHEPDMLWLVGFNHNTATERMPERPTTVKL